MASSSPFFLLERNASALDRGNEFKSRLSPGSLSRDIQVQHCRLLLAAGGRAHVDEVLPGQSGERDPIGSPAVLEIALDAG